jgi:hypothetical protein
MFCHRTNSGLRVLAVVLALLYATTARAQFGLPPEVTDYAAGLLAQWIHDSRAQAILEGVQPMPPRIYRALHDYFPAALLTDVRYRSGATSDDPLPFVAFRYGDATALTLGDVIVFRDPAAAQSDLKLWAHELTHVMQYRRWGLRGFAARYLSDRAGVEREAYTNADRFVAWHNGIAH